MVKALTTCDPEDIVLIADSAKNLQALKDRVEEACERFVMKLNCKNTKIFMVSKNIEISHRRLDAA